MQLNKKNMIIAIICLLIFTGWIFFVVRSLMPFYIQKEPIVTNYYGNTLSTYFKQALKDKPIADYKIPERGASVEVDISKIVSFKWDAALIENSSGYSSRICQELLLDEAECRRNNFDEIAKMNRYFITFVLKHHVVYKEIFSDEILRFGINTISRKMTPDDCKISVFRDMTVKYGKDDIKTKKFSDIAMVIIFPILGVLFGLRFFYPALVIGFISFVPIVLFFLAFSSGQGNPIGLVFFLMPAVTALFTGIGLLTGAILKKSFTS